MIEPPSREPSATADPVHDLSELRHRDWRRIVRDVRADLHRHRTSLLAAGIAFRVFLALFPTLIVATTALALLRPAAQITFQVRRITIGLPASARNVVIDQVEQIVSTDQTGLQVTFVVALVVAFWLSASAVQGMMAALTAVNDELPGRSWLSRRLLAMGLTLGAIGFGAAIVAVFTLVPNVYRWVGFDRGAGVLAIITELFVLAIMMVTALSVAYRFAPREPPPRWRRVSPGALLATLGWLAGSELFSQVVEHVGRYDLRFGAAAGVVVLMLWILLTTWCMLVGATVNLQLTRPDDSHEPARARREQAGTTPTERRGDREAERFSPRRGTS